MRSVLLAATALLAFAVARVPGAAAAPITFGYTGGFQTYTVSTSGVYDVIAYGAQGGFGFGEAPGRGAEVGGDFQFTAGQILTIAVGGQGSSSNAGGGGGGGSFVVLGSTPLVIAGGGGGAALFSGGDGQTGTAGGFSSGGAAGTNGSGGGSGPGFGGGGGGFNTSGDGGVFGGGGYPGLAGGGAGFKGTGGFGGGGGGGGGSAGGGGGYSGGGGSGFTSGGGGGGSLDASLATTGADYIQLAGVQIGNGLVTIDLVSTTLPTAVPEPASLALLGVGVAGVMAMRRRRAG